MVDSLVNPQGITEEELDEIRLAQETFFPSKIIIRRREFFPPDDYDHRKTVGENRPARITSGFGQFRNVADRFQGITPFTITTEWDEDIRDDDEVLDELGNVFHIRDVRKSSSYHTATQCLADLITDNA